MLLSLYLSVLYVVISSVAQSTVAISISSIVFTYFLYTMEFRYTYVYYLTSGPLGYYRSNCGA